MYLVIYDITSPKRLREVAKILNRYGRRIQKSAFECEIDERQYGELRETLLRTRQGNDAICAYRLPGRFVGDRLSPPAPKEQKTPNPKKIMKKR